MGSILNILFEFQIEIPLVEKWMECKFQKVRTFADVTGKSFKNWNLHCHCSYSTLQGSRDPRVGPGIGFGFCWSFVKLRSRCPSATFWLVGCLLQNLPLSRAWLPPKWASRFGFCCHCNGNLNIVINGVSLPSNDKWTPPSTWMGLETETYWTSLSRSDPVLQRSRWACKPCILYRKQAQNPQSFMIGLSGFHHCLAEAQVCCILNSWCYFPTSLMTFERKWRRKVMNSPPYSKP